MGENAILNCHITVGKSSKCCSDRKLNATLLCSYSLYCWVLILIMLRGRTVCKSASSMLKTDLKRAVRSEKYYMCI